MKAKRFSLLLIATFLSAGAMASVSTDRIHQANSQPLAPKTSAFQATPVSAENDQGHSEALTKAQTAVKQVTNRPTAHRADNAPNASLGRALDW